MSDITLGPGVAILFGGLFALLVGAVLLVAALLAGLYFVRNAPWQKRAFRFIAGPLTCLGFTIVLLLWSNFASEGCRRWLGRHYEAAPFVALSIALLSGGWYELARARRRRAR